jgi:hypothetical protein
MTSFRANFEMLDALLELIAMTPVDHSTPATVL